MARSQDSERYELSDGKKHDLIELIKKGKPFPEKYRFLLFADKREAELVWNGKTREVCAVSHACAKSGRFTIAVKVIDIFGNDTMTLVPVTAG